MRLPPIDTAEGANYYQVSHQHPSFTRLNNTALSYQSYTHLNTTPRQRFYTGLLGGVQLPSSAQDRDAGFINAVFADHASSRDSGGDNRRNLLLSGWAVGGDWAGGAGAGGIAFPSLFLLEEGRVAPVERAVAGRSYTVAVSGFNRAVAGVEIRLYEGVPPIVREEATVTLPKIAAGEEGERVMRASFVAPEPAGGRGRSRAYLRASYAGLPMPFADSLAFDLVGSGGEGR